MTKSISIPYSSLDTSTIDSFLHAWNRIGSWELMKTNVYKLIGHNNEKSVLSIQDSLIKIDGNIPKEADDLIAQLSRHLQSSGTNQQQVQTEYVEVLEGEVIDQNTQQSQQERMRSQFQAQFQQLQWSNLPLKSKLKFGLFIIIAIPLLLVLIPIAIVVTVIRVLIFKFFRR